MMEAVETNNNGNNRSVDVQKHTEYLAYLKMLQEQMRMAKAYETSPSTEENFEQEKGHEYTLRNGNVPSHTLLEENQKAGFGYTSIPMLAFLTFLFEALFLLIAFQIFR